MAAIGIVIVTYNSGHEIGRCLDAAVRSGAEVVVVDNASVDGTREEVSRRGVKLIANPVNRGFAVAVNQGFAVLNCTHVLLLNPDAVIESQLDTLRKACDLPGSAGAGGQLRNPDGTLQQGFMVRRLPTATALIFEVLLVNRIWPDNPSNQHYRAANLDYSARSAVEQPAGAFLMVRRAVWQELGGLDEGFFPLWFEDVDFCRRIIDHGYKLYYVPHAVAKHTGGHSIPSLTVEMRRFYWYRSLLRYASKHFGLGVFRVVCLAVVTGSILRMLVSAVSERSLQPMAVYAKIVRLAGRCLMFGPGDGVILSGLAS